VVLRARTATNSVHLFTTMGTFCALCMLAAIGFHIDLPLPITISAGVAALLAVVYLWRMFPAVNVPNTFQCPLVPFVPCAGISVNIIMMSGLDASAWLRLGLWTMLGLAIYFSYSIRHSKLRLAAAAGKLQLQGAAGGALEQTEHDSEALLAEHRRDSSGGGVTGGSQALTAVRKSEGETVRGDQQHPTAHAGGRGNVQYQQVSGREDRGGTADAVSPLVGPARAGSCESVSHTLLPR
jgi:hypothetical protein